MAGDADSAAAETLDLILTVLRLDLKERAWREPVAIDQFH
jgi:hypothetical protein